MVAQACSLKVQLVPSIIWQSLLLGFYHQRDLLKRELELT